MTIIEEALHLLIEQGAAERQSVAEVVASESYLGVVLKSGAMGWALCYSGLGKAERQERASELIAASRHPLLIDCLFPEQANVRSDSIVEALRVALVSALAEPLWRQPESFGLKSFAGVPASLFGEPETALVVGFGGLMFQIAACASVRHLVVADLTLPRRRRRMEAIADILTMLNPRLTCKLTDGRDIRLAASCADLLSITGSALSNGTMEDLLGLPKRSEAVIVVQGQSAAIHPAPLFQRGASVVVSCVKPYQMLKIAKEDLRPGALEQFTENRREWTSLVQS